MYAFMFGLAILAQLTSGSNGGLACGGSACAYYFDGITGTSVSDLLNAQSFKTFSRSQTRTLDKLETQENYGENYGVMVEAWLKPPTTGLYRFSTRSDDASAVYVSPTADTKPSSSTSTSGMMKVVELTGCCQTVEGTTLIRMEVGKSYYMVGYMKEGGGGDYFQIGMKIGGTNYFPVSNAQLGYLSPQVSSGSQVGGAAFTRNQETSQFPVDIGKAPALGLTGETFTASAWVFRTGEGNGDFTIFGAEDTPDKGGDAGSRILHLTVRQGGFHMGFFGNDCGPAGTSKRNEWQHVSFVYSNGAMEIFVDGSSVKRCTGKGRYQGQQTVNIGKWGGGNWFVGKIKEAKIWKRALSTSELNTLATPSAGSAQGTGDTALQCGQAACAYYYNGISGSSVQNLLQASSFPNSPSKTDGLDKLETIQSYGENYGVMVEAWIKPSTTGDYRFFTKSDDASAVYVSRQAGVKFSSHASMTMVVELTGCCKEVQGSVNIHMEAGKSYYLRGYMKEAGGGDYFHIGMQRNGGGKHMPISGGRLGLVNGASTGPCNTGSEFTQKMIAKLNPAQENFGKCNDDIQEIKSALEDLSENSADVRAASENFEELMGAVTKVIEKINSPPPKGTGIAHILGKIPKIGIFIKMGLKQAEVVIKAVDKLADRIKKLSTRIDQTITVVKNSFVATGTLTDPTAKFLVGSHRALEAAHGCAQSTGYICGSLAGKMEDKNREVYPNAAPVLEEVSNGGKVCHDVLNPISTLMREMAAMAKKIAKILQPILDALKAVKDFVKELEKKIQEFIDALQDSDAAQCALEIFEPVTDTVNLVTCPVNEVAGAVMHFVIEEMLRLIDNVVQQALNEGINKAVDAMVPDNLDLNIPDFQSLLPTDFWFATCTAASLAWPEHAQTIQQLANLPLPKRITGKDIENSILANALVATGFSRPQGSYVSACVTAYNEMGTDFKSCEKLFCDASTAIHQATTLALDGAQRTFNAAKGEFDRAKGVFDDASRELNKVKGELTKANKELDEAKKGCPNCRCGGCAWDDGNCHAENLWCCPAKRTCNGAINAAQGTVNTATNTVSTAQTAFDDAKNAMDDAKRGMDDANGQLDEAKKLNDESHRIMTRDCNRRRLEILTPRRLGAEPAPLELPAPSAA